MESSDQDLINKLLTKSSDLKLAKNVIFVFSDGELSGGELISKLDNNEELAKIFKSSNTEVEDSKSDKSSEHKIQISTYESSSFINLLKCIYIGKVNKDLTKIASTYLIAKQYSLNIICKRILKYADQELRIDSSTLIYDQYLQIGNDIKQSKLNEIIDIISVHAFVAFLSPFFKKITYDTLIKILEIDQLFIQEKDVYYSCCEWINAELTRKDHKIDHENRSNLFNKIKHLIRFPIMSEFQFFKAERKARSSIFKNQIEFEKNPALSGLFNEIELKEFKEYFKTKDPSVLTINYNTNERINQMTKMNIEYLDLQPYDKDDKRLKYKLVTDIDGLLRKNEPRDDVRFCSLDSQTYIEGENTSYSYTYGENYEEIKTPKLTIDLRRNHLVCTDESIRIFRIHMTGSSSCWDYGTHIQFYENGVFVPTYYERYIIKYTFGYFDFWPSIQFKLNNVYKLDFLTPGEGRPNGLEFRLDRIYSTNSDGQRVIDVELKHINKMKWEQPTKFFFMYKK